MKETPFPDNSNKPTERSIQTAMGNMYTCYKNLMGLVSSYSQEWIFTKSSGWMLKIYDRKKALFYLIPLIDGFKISLAIREIERGVFLSDTELGIIHGKISSSRKVSEGYALQFDLVHQNEFQIVESLLKKLITIRG